MLKRTWKLPAKFLAYLSGIETADDPAYRDSPGAFLAYLSGIETKKCDTGNAS